MSSSERADASSRHALTPNTEILDADLPINAHREDIMAALRDHSVIVVAGETGSGKTTQLPRFALAAGFGRNGLIAHTQPRRIAARSVAARIAEETGMPLGTGVAYAIRFDDRTSPQTMVRIMTDGLLLNDAQRDRELRRYEVVIIDEAHERSLNIDVLLGLLKRLVKRRRDLKVIITSATIDVTRFSEFFDGAPVIEVSGRGYPVSIEYAGLEIATDDSRRLARQVCDGVAQLSDRTLPKAAEDILVFLPGEREIRDAERALAKAGFASRGFELVPLYGRLADSAQQQVFKAASARRIVLATNVAETSITVPRIGAVVDTGIARINRYSPRARITQLQLEKISQASANQRSGRCGRIGPGICVRLYAEDDFDERSSFTDPEMLRTNLSSVILQIASLGVGDVRAFPFPDDPDAGRLDDALRELRELKALDRDERITKLGRRLARLPVDPRLGAMLLAARQPEIQGAVLLIVAALSIQDPRQRPVESAGNADLAHAEFAHNESDFLSFLKLWAAVEEQRNEGRGHFERWCTTHFLSARRLREWREIAAQLARQLQIEWPKKLSPLLSDKTARQRVHEAILAGLLTRIGQLTEPGEYETIAGRRFGLFKSSALHDRKTRWIMALEVVQTHRAMARYAAGIAPSGVAGAAAHLTRFEYGEPYWNVRKGRVEARRSTLLGKLVLVANRRVPIDNVYPERAREVFIREALVGDQLGQSFAFADFNRSERAALEALSGQLRRAVEVRSSEIAKHFDKTLPRRVFSRATLVQWLKVDRRNDAKMRVDRSVLLSEAAAPDLAATPVETDVRGNTLALSYRFAPDKSDDGATLAVPVGLLGALTESEVEQTVPAFLQQRIVARLRALPKSDRKRLHPINETAQRIVMTLSALPESALSLNDRLGGVLLREFDIQIARGVWDGLVEPEHWYPRISVLDEQGDEIAVGRDLGTLREQCAPDFKQAIAEQAKPVAKQSGGFPVLEPPHSRQRGGASVTVFPALLHQGATIGVHEYLDPLAASESHDAAILEMLRRRFRDAVKLLRKDLTRDRQVMLLWATFDDEGGAALLDDLVNAALRAAFGERFSDIREANSWNALCERGAAQLVPEGSNIRALLPGILTAHADCRRQIDKTSQAYAEAKDDVGRQIARLTFPGFLMATPPSRVSCLERYLSAAALRLERVAGNNARDIDSMAMVRSLEARYDGLTTYTGVAQREAANAFRWLIEELRVSLFAQTLGTSEKVSLRRLEKRWDEILRMPAGG